MSKDVYMLCEVDGNQEKRPVDSNILEVNCEISKQESVITTITTDKTAKELYSAVHSGKFIASKVAMDDLESLNILPCYATKLTQGSSAFYNFLIILFDDAGSIQYVSTNNSENDTVVFTLINSN